MTFQDFAKKMGGDTEAIHYVETALKTGALFAYYISSGVLVPYDELKLPDSLAFRLYQKMDGLPYRGADGLFFFDRELTTQERLNLALEQANSDVSPATGTGSTKDVRRRRLTQEAFDRFKAAGPKVWPWHSNGRMYREDFMNALRGLALEEFHQTEAKQLWKDFAAELGSKKVGRGRKPEL